MCAEPYGHPCEGSVAVPAIHPAFQWLESEAGYLPTPQLLVLTLTRPCLTTPVSPSRCSWKASCSAHATVGATRPASSRRASRTLIRPLGVSTTPKRKVFRRRFPPCGATVVQGILQVEHQGSGRGENLEGRCHRAEKRLLEATSSCTPQPPRAICRSCALPRDRVCESGCVSGEPMWASRCSKHNEQRWCPYL